MIRIFGTVLAALAGLAFGSFLNVCLSRWPAGESVVKPRSHCRSCTRTLKWWENVPLVSWLALRGRCRTCGALISWRYPMVEFAVGALWALIMWRFMAEALDPRLPSALVYYELGSKLGMIVFLWLLVALAILDAENLWLPNWITLPGIAAGFVFSVSKLVVLVRVDSITGLPLTEQLESVPYGLYGVVLEYLVGILAAGGLVVLIRWIYWVVRRREGIGVGDAKLMAMLAAWLGLPGALLAFVIGVVLGSLAAMLLLALPEARRGSETWALTKLPLGTFLCIGGIISALWGERILTAYLRWSGLS
jgi:leader peptidase (prepilin peptidase)/N-methyltransferase